MKNIILTITIATLLTGCAGVRNNQADKSTTQTTTVYADRTVTEIETRDITTETAATTFAASKQALSKWKVNQTDKTQSASVGELGQESNLAELLQALLALGKLAAAMSTIGPAGAAVVR